MLANFSRKGMLRQHVTRKKRPRHTVFVCHFANTDPHHAPEEVEEGRRLYYNCCRCCGDIQANNKAYNIQANNKEAYDIHTNNIQASNKAYNIQGNNIQANNKEAYNIQANNKAYNIQANSKAYDIQTNNKTFVL